MELVVNSRVSFALPQIIDKHQCMRLNNQKHPSVVQLSLQNQHVRIQKFPYDWVTNKIVLTVG